MGTLGERFAEAIADRDLDIFTGLFAETVDFRGLTPGKVWDASDPAGVVDVVLGHWFEEKDEILSVQRAEAEPVLDTQHVGYRFEIVNPDGPHVAEQQAYYRVEDDHIVWMRVLCSGFRPRD
ncbi:MAG: hypothetical protein ABWY19_02035 [Marmoricola sp.]